MATGVTVLGYIMSPKKYGYGQWGVGYIVRQGAAFVCLLGFGDIVIGQGSGISTWDPVKTICNINLARGVIVGQMMYVDGGEIIDQQNYQFGIDKPYYYSNMFPWQSKSPSDQCPILFS